MAFFDNLKKKAKDIGGVASEKAQDLAVAASEKAQDLADNVKISAAISSEKRAIEKNYRAIGEWVVNEMEGEIPTAIEDLVTAIHTSQSRIEELEESRPSDEDDKVKETTAVCPNCGAKVTTRFCPDCGKEVVQDAPEAEEGKTE